MELPVIRQMICNMTKDGHLQIRSPANAAPNSKSREVTPSSICTRIICRKSPSACNATSACRVTDIHSPLPDVKQVPVRSGSKYPSWRGAARRLGRNWRKLGTSRNFFGIPCTNIRAAPSRDPSGRHHLRTPVFALPGEYLRGSVQGTDFTSLYKTWNDPVSPVNSLNLLREGLDRLWETAASIATKGFELSESAASKLGDFTLPSQTSKALLEELDRLEQSAAGILSKGSEILESVAAKSGEIALPSQYFHLLSETSSNSVNSPSMERLGQSASRLIASAGTLSSDFLFKVSHLTGDFVHLDWTAISHSSGQLISECGTVAGGYYDGLGPNAAPLAFTALATVAGTVVATLSYNASRNIRMFVEGEDLPLRYDPVTIGLFFRRRPTDILLRSLKIILECSALTVRILVDLSSGNARENERRRAVQLVDLITRLGPTAIKIGQAMSIRPDILPVVYLEELQKLQDRVPPFSNEEAKVLIFQGLGKTAQEVFSEMSDSPVAAASLGQVYKGRLRETGQEVAIKVQRPGVLEGISRDLFLLRTGAYALQAIPIIQSDLIALLDTWAFRFFDELDYVQEGNNSKQFAENMKSLANVTVPAVYMEHTSRKVLTTQWIDGEKLSESRSDDLLPLVSTALNCYLIQLLESGFLHADPHPGNLLRTPDGRLCVLDFGLMTQVTEDQRYALIDYISHLVNADYAKVAEDLVKLGFVPPDLEDPKKTASVVPQLSLVLGQLVQGGGARKINIQQVTNDLANMAKDYVFVLPPYFALILRAFSVLEGIGLEADPDYTIVNECYPYISKRLLTDNSPRTRAALKDFLYGGKEQLNMQRVEEIVGGFQLFRDVMAPAGEDGRPLQKSQVLDPTTKEALMSIFAPEGSYIQELLLTELVRIVDALSRETIAELWGLIASTIRIPGLPVPAPLSVPGSWPLPVPGLFLGLTPVARLSQEDEQSLDTVKRIWRLLEPTFMLPSPEEILEFSWDSIPLLFNLLPGVTPAARRFTVMLLQRITLRLADDLDGTNSVLEWNKDPTASARHIQPWRLFNFQSGQKNKQ